MAKPLIDLTKETPMPVETTKPKFNLTDWIQVPSGFLERYVAGNNQALRDNNSLRNLFVNHMEDLYDEWIRQETQKLTRKGPGRPRSQE